ncbi:MAG: sigma-54-dependent Fis family transcriptional regulator [Bacteroidetes bacterium]|nr:sigma-54-dependent Fis family transcriptional regulator [Bacteroidota bacterium]
MKEKKTILVVDDEPSMRKNVVELLSREGFSVFEACDGREALDFVKTHPLNLILLDINLPKLDGISVLKEIKNEFSDLPVIVFTAYGTSERAIEAMKTGAYDYLDKPFELDEFLLIVRRALNYGDLLGEVKQLRSTVSFTTQISATSQLVGTSPKIQEIYKLIGRAAPSDATVLIQGESGTGKELIADAIQRHSLRKDKPFIKVDCGGLTETLLESELFGHEKGAFTGAVSQRKGRFELADGGTIFLDEVNNMSPTLQMKLLRVLQQKTFERVGGKDTLTVDVRVIAATNKNLEEEMKAGRFRQDLFYRLNVIHIVIPPLRERPEDIPILIQHFLKKIKPAEKIIIPDESLNILLSYSWPGNVRELENVIHRALVISHGDIITIDHLPLKGQANEESAPVSLDENFNLKTYLNEIEKKIIIEALKKTNWNRTQTAKLLKINRRLLFSKMYYYGLKEK